MRRDRSVLAVAIRALAPLAVAVLLLMPAAARAERALVSRQVVDAEELPGEQIEGACGLAIDNSSLYVSDYYHRTVEAFDRNPFGGFTYRSELSGDPLDGPCQLAISPDGSLYANDWHEGVERLAPSPLQIDGGESTGVAVDGASGTVYVDDRTSVAVYEPSGAPVTDGEGHPLRIGLGSLGDGYGLAFAAGRLYVPDAADGTIKVYEPATDTAEPVATIDGSETPKGRFVSLVNAAVAIDPLSGNLLVVDNLQPGFEAPEAAIDEFDTAAGAFLGQLPTHIVDGEPAGLALDAEGDLFVTSGNSEDSQVYKFGPYVAPPAPPGGSTEAVAAASPAAPGPSPAAPRPAPDAAAPPLLQLSGSSASGGPVATLRLSVAAAGRVVVTGRLLAPVRRRLEPGAALLRLHLNRAGRRALARRHRLRVSALLSFSTAGERLRQRRRIAFGARRSSR
ncbi:MAG TPA: hypothetical protein VFK14_11715 [Solirubrobacterales bacterium]|nr:hypothetical protein [Solirubrobacterales bacterium]